MTEREMLEMFIIDYNNYSRLYEACKYDLRQTLDYEACKYDLRQTLDENLFKQIHSYLAKMDLLHYYIKRLAENLDLTVDNWYCETFKDYNRNTEYKYIKYRIIE